jgi:hypothetical protein
MKLSTPFLLSLLATVACGGADVDDSFADAGADDGGVTGQRMFVTRSTFEGQLGGLSGADQICQNAAAAASLGGDWTAWLSDGNQDAINRIIGEGPWQTVTGEEIFRNRAALSGSPLVGILEQEDGANASMFSSVWTGTKTGGTADTPNCSEWTSTEGEGRAGKTGSVGGWTQSVNNACISMRHLYCFEN